MLFRNDLFRLDGSVYRLLESDTRTGWAWVIAIDQALAWPIRITCDELVGVTREEKNFAVVTHDSSAMRRKRDKAWERLQVLLTRGGKLYEPSQRQRAVEEVAGQLECSARTLQKDLRRYWQRGQTPEALLPDFANCGRGTLNLTSRRGTTPKQDYCIFQVTESDIEKFKSVIESIYLKDSRKTMPDVYLTLLQTHYQYSDGNGVSHIAPLGSRPTLRQFTRYMRKNYKMEVRIRGREGNKEFERNHRATLSTALADCQGVGDIYEIDASIADVYLVAKGDVNTIIGKPTIYFIVDRKSRLIVGFYFGLENPSWVGAMQAILSLSVDKAALCARFGVDYKPEDWPAHEVFPNQFMGDRGGDMIGRASNQAVDGFGISFTNAPALRPDFKGTVESTFKVSHEPIKDVAAAYDPPSNAMKRRGKHYEKDACWTLDDFSHVMLNVIISHNRKQMLNYELSIEELSSGIRPTPIELWNHGIRARMGQLSRYAEEYARLKLLPRAMAVVDDRGIQFLGCSYSCPQAVAQGWFIEAKKRRFKVDVSYDPRLVDNIYVYDPNGKSAPYRAELTQRSAKYSGLSSAETKYWESVRAGMRNEAGQTRLQNKADFRDSVAATVSAAAARLAREGTGKTRTARRADTKAARVEERRLERQETALPRGATPMADSSKHPAPLLAVPKNGNQMNVGPTAEVQPLSDASAELHPAGLSTRQEMLARARKQLTQTS
jgi:putative transposase